MKDKDKIKKTFIMYFVCVILFAISAIVSVIRKDMLMSCVSGVATIVGIILIFKLYKTVESTLTDEQEK